jgi:hypothetical protein
MNTTASKTKSSALNVIKKIGPELTIHTCHVITAPDDLRLELVVNDTLEEIVIPTQEHHTVLIIITDREENSAPGHEVITKME